MHFKSNFIINIILSNVEMTLIAAHLNAGVVLGGGSVAFDIVYLVAYLLGSRSSPLPKLIHKRFGMEKKKKKKEALNIRQHKTGKTNSGRTPFCNQETGRQINDDTWYVSGFSKCLVLECL